MSAFSAIDLDDAVALDVGDHGAADTRLRYGVEVMSVGDWRPVRGWRGQVRLYATRAEATQAAVAAWRRSDCAARPFIAS